MVFLQQFLVEACCFLLNAGPWARHMGDAGVLSGTERKREWNGHRKEEGMERNGNAMGNAMGNAVLSHGIVDDSGIFTGSN